MRPPLRGTRGRLTPRALYDGAVIEALLFDFDGLLVDSETVAFQTWQEAYREQGAELLVERWAAAIGTIDGFDPLAHLEESLGRAIDREAVEEAQRARELALVHEQPLRPGVLEYLAEARARELHVAIVSSSSNAWIAGHLERLETADGWACIVCANGDAARAKPRPTLYLEALETVGVAPDAAIAFEDSPNGVVAARAARIFCVAVPNSVTAQLDLSAADLLVESLQDVPLGELLRVVAERRAA
jgi:HAD superfamily hydrolase (TIGR01509 family)